MVLIASTNPLKDKTPAKLLGRCFASAPVAVAVPRIVLLTARSSAPAAAIAPEKTRIKSLTVRTDPASKAVAAKVLARLLMNRPVDRICPE